MPEPIPSNPPVKTGAVLLVDDERQLIELYGEVLSRRYEVDLAGSTEEAGRMILKKKYKVIVSDYDMPGGNGLNFLTKLRKEHPEIRRILMTSYMQPEFVRGLNAADPFHYLLKPIAFPTLLKWVDDAAKDYDLTQSGA